MRDNPRYSIIPAGAVVDPRLEGRDLQVLGLLGCHTDKLGWVEANSQAALAKLIACSRQSLQRSIARLVEAGWVQTKTSFVSETGRPYAAYAYRVLMDQDDPDPAVPKYEVEPPQRDGVPTGGHGCPPATGRGCPDIRGQQDSGPSRDLKDSDSACAREGPSCDAAAIADEIAEMAGVDPAKHAAWFIAGPALIVQRFLSGGYHRWQLLEGVRRGMARRTTPPDDIRYFQKLWTRVRGEADTPAPPAEPPSPQRQRASSPPRPGSRDETRERTVNAMRRLNEFANAGTDVEGAGGSVGEPPAARLSLPKSA